MTSLQKQIAERFISMLIENPDLDPVKLAQLKTLAEGDKKPKAEDFVRIFSQPAGGDVE